jgi:aspartyl-tRNA(Asn)/glutamyl-tRNA(Gln) amidotransferase subunit C
MPIDRQTVVHVADLARIALTEDEVERFTGQISVVLDAVARLGEVDTSTIAPTASVLPLQDVYRDDKPRPGLTTDQALANAPRGGRDGEFFRVQEVLEQR